MSLGRRRLLGGALALGAAGLLAGCGRVALPWQPATVRRVGFLAGAPPNQGTLPPFLEGMRELGWAEGQSFTVEWRNGDGDDDLDRPAAELLALRPEVIVVPGTSPLRAALARTSSIPIVNAGQGNLLSSGLVASMGRPGGNVTGMNTPSLTGKQLELLKATVPSLVRVGVIWDTVNNGGTQQAEQSAEAQQLGLVLDWLPIVRPDDLEPAIEAAVRQGVGGLSVLTGGLIVANQGRIAELAARHRLPSTWGQSEAVDRGGLMSYGVNRADLSRRGAAFVDKILKGARAADLPVEQPTKYDFRFNLKTAEAIGLKIPDTVLSQVTEVLR